MRLLPAIALVTAVLSSPLWAQTSFAGGAAPPTVSAWGRVPGQPARSLTGTFPHPQPAAPQFFPAAVFLGNAWLGYETPPPQPPAPVIVLQNPPAAAPASEPPASGGPVLIEWQGDRYMRFSGTAEASLRKASADYSAPVHSATKAKGDAVSELPPTVLVFRDGHLEEISEYSIINAALYTSGNFWESGTWTRRIPVSALDIPATIAANREAGVKFVLPTGPNVVVTRP